MEEQEVTDEPIDIDFLILLFTLKSYFQSRTNEPAEVAVKKQTKPIDMDLLIWALELEEQGFVVDRNLIIQRPEWPFVLRVVIDADTGERVLKLGIHGFGKKVIFVQQSIARGQQQVIQEVKRLGNLTEEQIGQAHLAAHVGILSVLFPRGV